MTTRLKLTGQKTGRNMGVPSAKKNPADGRTGAGKHLKE